MSADTGHFVRLVFRALARLFPFRAPPGREHITAAELKPQFKGWDTRVVLILFVCAPFTVWACKTALAACFPPPSAPAGALFVLTTDPMFFLLPGIFLGLVLAALPVMGITRLLLGKRFPDYILYGNLLVGFDTVKIWITMSAVVAFLAVALAAAAGGVHLTVFNDHLELRHFAQARSVVIPASQVVSATVDGDGALKFAFADGTAWSSTGDLGLLTPTAGTARAIALRFGPLH
jgi:hypothetical protein